MIDINDAIEQSKAKEDISDGGSECFDFSDVVLVKYKCALKWLKDNERERDCEEIVMEGINQKVKDGVNTPRHIAMKRVVEGNEDVCYVLQEKCPGQNCATMRKEDVSYDDMISSLEFIYNIPFDHYKKLISDGCQLYEMGHEAKNKNLFYDKESGFWYIDFLDYDKENPFDDNDPIKVSNAMRIIPKPIQISSSARYNEELSPEQKEKSDFLEYSIQAKTILAIKSVIPNFERYEKFYLFGENDGLKQYLMEHGVVKKDLFKLEDDDYPLFDELYETVVNHVSSKIIEKYKKIWYVENNDIRIDSGLFCLMEMWSQHKDNPIDKSDYEDEYEYDYALRSSFTEKMLGDIAQKLEGLEKNENSTRFLDDFYSKYENHAKK